MITFNCNKLARDKTLANMKNAGIVTRFKILTPQEHLISLNLKLIEESLEVKDAANRTEIVAELADVFEILDVIRKKHGISQTEVRAAKHAKRKERGGFEKGIFLETIQMDENNIWVKHFRASPEKYTESKE